MTNGGAAEEHDVPPPPRARVDDAVGGADPAAGTTPAAAEPPEAARPPEAAAGERITGPAEGHEVAPPARARVDDALGGADPADRATEPAPGRGRAHLPEHGREDRRARVLRITGLMAGVLGLATAFIAAYVGALHRPTPKDVPVAVVRGDAPARTVLDAIRARTDALNPIEYADAAAAERALDERDVYAVIGSARGAPGLLVTTASAAGPPATQVIIQLVAAAAQQARVPVTVVDVVPVAAEDPRGLVPFYFTVGLVLGGYLASTVLGLSAGTLPHSLRNAAARIGAFALFSVLLGLAAALVVGPAIGVWNGHIADLAAVGALVAFAAATAGAALQGWLGLVGTGLVIALVVVLGNPGSGGIYPPEFLPTFFRSMHRWNLPGLGADLTKSVVYFGGKGGGTPLTGLAIWAVAGLAALLAATAVLPRSRRR